MALSAQERVKKYQTKCDAIMLRPPKSSGAEIRAAAQESGQSLQGYILQACRAAMDPTTVSIPLTGEGVSPEAVKQAAEAAGMSVNAWIIQAIKDKL